MKREMLKFDKFVPSKPEARMQPHSATLPSKRSLIIIELGGFHSTMMPVTKNGENIGGAAYVADAVTRIRQQADPILISNGDIFTGQIIGVESGADLVIQFMNQLTFGAVTLGIHDFDDGQITLAQRLEEAKFPVLAANLALKETNQHIKDTTHPLSIVKPYIMLERGLQTIIVLGMMKEDTEKYQKPSNLEGLKFWPVRETIMHWIPSILEERPNVIIIQYNKPSEAEELAVYINECANKWGSKNYLQVLPFLIFIGGHNDEKPIHGPNYLIMQGTDRGYNLGIIKIKQEYKFNKVVPEYTKISDKWYSPDPNVSRLVEKLKHTIDLQDMLLCETKGFLNREKLIDSPLGILITEVMKNHAKAEIAFISSGTTKMDIPPGEIYASSIDQAIPFKDTIVLMELSGEIVQEILEQAAKLEADSGGSGGKVLQVAGIRFKYSLKREKGKRVTEVSINGEKVDKSRIYKAAVSKYLADGGDGYFQFKKVKAIEETGELRTVIKDFIKGKKVIDIKRDMRIEYEA